MPTEYSVVIRGPRGDEWKKVIGRSTFPVQFPPVLAHLPGHGQQPAYMLDIPSLTKEEFRCIAEHLMRKFRLKEKEAIQEMRDRGIPIWLAETTLLIHFPPTPGPLK